MDLFDTPLNPTKRLKEEFVSNLSGSSMLEIAALSTAVPAFVVLRKWSCFGRKCSYAWEDAMKKDNHVNSFRKSWTNYIAILTMDYFGVILPMLLTFTILAEWAYACMVLVTLVMCFYAAVKRPEFHNKEGRHHSSLRTVISSYRVTVVLLTCLCILAVDFHIFPRRYAKTETYGTSLMDLGVGAFILANSLVSRQARSLNSMNWWAALRSISPVVLLGFGRLIFTRGVDYQVHVGEYGVHWNFFFTLAAVSILTSFISIHPRYCGLFGLVVLIGYQVCLICGLSQYLISNERKADIFSQNKEGLFSIFGYWGMYLIGVHLGYKLVFKTPARDGSVQSARVEIWVICALFWFLTIILDRHVEKVSRRTCNLAYVTFVFAANFQALSVLTLADFFFTDQNLVLEDAFNQNMLGSFLLANVLTGVINLSLDTLSVSSVTAFVILLGYSFILTVAVGLACFCGIKIKFW